MYVIMYHNEGGALRFHEIFKSVRWDPYDPPSGLRGRVSFLLLGQDVGPLTLLTTYFPAWCHTLPNNLDGS